MEVVVSFLGGDLDRPVVMGCVANAQNPLPYPVPNEVARSGIRTRSMPGGGGSNEITFDDRTGREQLYMHAERDFDQVVKRNHTVEVRGDERLRVFGGRMDIVEDDAISRVGGSVEEHAGGSRAAVVGGADTVRITGSRTAEVGGSDASRVTGDLDLTIGGARSERIGKSDTLFVKGDHKTIVHGEDARIVWANARMSVTKKIEGFPAHPDQLR